MRIAIPVAEGLLAMHFGHCEKFALIEVGEDKKGIVQNDMLDAPPHQPGLLPRWLARQGANLIIAGGMGGRALSLFQEQGIKVIVGAPAKSPEDLVGEYLAGKLETGGNVCDH